MICETCSKKLIRTPSGYVCEEGHGKIISPKAEEVWQELFANMGDPDGWQAEECKPADRETEADD